MGQETESAVMNVASWGPDHRAANEAVFDSHQVWKLGLVIYLRQGGTEMSRETSVLRQLR